MSTALLERKKIELPAEKQSVANPFVETQKRPRPNLKLEQALQELEIGSFTEKSVRKYRRAKRREVAPNIINYLFWRPAKMIAITSGFIAATCFLSMIVVFAFWLLWSGAAYLFSLSPGDKLWEMLWEMLELFSKVFLPSSVCSAVFYMIWREQEQFWKLMPLDHYLKLLDNLNSCRRTLPLFVCETVEAIRARCPEAIFEVDYLVKEEDPFLVVREGRKGQRFYIEVWEEPSYQATRLA